MKVIREAFNLIRTERRAFNLINIGYFTIVLIGMLIVRSSSELQQGLISLIGEAFSTGPMQYLTGAYTNGEIIKAIGLTFFVNLILGSFIALTIPSLIIPFSGFLVGAYRALLWGFIFSPDLGDLSFSKIIMGIGIGLLLILEGEAYVLALGYLSGIRLSLRMYLLVIGMLLIAAFYEVSLAIIILPALV
jgi:hypothetical protein